MSATKWIQVGGSFPPTLNSLTAPELLRPNETPSAYGLNVDTEGYLAAGSIPTGVAHNAGSIFNVTCGVGPYDSGADVVWRKYYNRLWYSVTTSNELLYGSPWYLDKYVPQGPGYMAFPDLITGFIPMGRDGFAVFTHTTGTPITPRGMVPLTNCADTRGFLLQGQLRERLGINSYLHAIDVGPQVACSTAGGVFLFDEDKTEELTRPVRGDATFNNADLTIVRAKNQIVGKDGADAKFVIDLSPEEPRIFDYDTSGFLYTSRRVRDSGDSSIPFCIEGVAFDYTTSDDANATMTVQMQRDQTGYDTAKSLTLKPNSQENQNRYTWIPNKRINGREFDLQITAMSSNMRISAIYFAVSRGIHDGYTGKG